MTNVRDEEPKPYVIPLSVDGTELLSFDATDKDDGRGWASYFSPQVARVRAMVLLRIGPEDGPPAELVSVGDSFGLAFTADHAAASALEVRELRVAVGPKTAGFASALLREIPFTRIEAAVNHPEHRRFLNGRVLPANAVSSGNTPGGVAYTLPPASTPVELPNLEVEDPGGYRKPDDFYRRVADIYLRTAAVSTRPAQEIAEANSIPPATVHRWIREAKARGVLLLPAHRAAPDVEG